MAPDTPTLLAPKHPRFWPMLLAYLMVGAIFTVPLFAIMMGLAIIVSVIIQPTAGIWGGLHIWKWVACVVLSSMLSAAARMAWRNSRRTGAEAES